MPETDPEGPGSSILPTLWPFPLLPVSYHPLNLLSNSLFPFPPQARPRVLTPMKLYKIVHCVRALSTLLEKQYLYLEFCYVMRKYSEIKFPTVPFQSTEIFFNSMTCIHFFTQLRNRLTTTMMTGDFIQQSKTVHIGYRSKLGIETPFNLMNIIHGVTFHLTSFYLMQFRSLLSEKPFTCNMLPQNVSTAAKTFTNSDWSLFFILLLLETLFHWYYSYTESFCLSIYRLFSK